MGGGVRDGEGYESRKGGLGVLVMAGRAGAGRERKLFLVISFL